MQTQPQVSPSEQILAVQQQINLLEVERAEKAQALSVPTDTPREKLAEVATQLAEVELDRLRRMVAIDLELATLRAKLSELEEQQQQQLRQDLESRVDAARESLSAKSEELRQLVARSDEIILEARKISTQIAPDWALSETKQPFLQQLPTFTLRLPRIVPSSLGNFILTNTEP